MVHKHLLALVREHQANRKHLTDLVVYRGGTKFCTPSIGGSQIIPVKICLILGLPCRYLGYVPKTVHPCTLIIEI